MRITRMSVLPLLALAAVVRADEPKKAEGEKHWGYTHDITPSRWGQVSPTCATGTHQSPIALSSKHVKAQTPEQPLEFSWSKSTGELIDTGHSFQVNLPPGNGITYAGTRYELAQFHFHSPSEHTVDGKAAPMEAHFVHKAADGKLAVVGVLLKQGSTASPFAPVLAALPASGETRTVEVDLPALLPADHKHFAYAGSLTTPPCSEDVQWIVLVAKDGVSKGEMDAFKARYPKDARPVQSLHGRTVEIAP